MGWASLPDGSRHAFLYAEGELTDLNDVIPQAAGWELRAAEGINARGQIVGYGMRNGQTRGFLISPLHPLPPAEPSCGYSAVYLPAIVR